MNAVQTMPATVADVIAAAAREAANFMRSVRTVECHEHSLIVWADGEVELTPTVNVEQLLYNEDQDGNDARNCITLMRLDPDDALDPEYVTQVDEDPSDEPDEAEVEMWASCIAESDDGRIAKLLGI